MDNSNELAFPATHSWRDEQPEVLTYSGGLTKREYFAAMAMQGLLAKYGYDNVYLPQKALEIADDTLRRLEPEQTKVYQNGHEGF